MNHLAIPHRLGFSLIELLVVIVIIVVMAGMLLPTVRIVRDRARTASCGANLRSLAMAACAYAQEQNGLLAINSTQPYYSRVNANWYGIGLLYDGGYIDTAAVAFCPANIAYRDLHLGGWSQPPASAPTVYSGYLNRRPYNYGWKDIGIVVDASSGSSMQIGSYGSGRVLFADASLYWYDGPMGPISTTLEHDGQVSANAVYSDCHVENWRLDRIKREGKPPVAGAWPYWPYNTRYYLSGFDSGP